MERLEAEKSVIYIRVASPQQRQMLRGLGSGAELVVYDLDRLEEPEEKDKEASR